MAGVRLLRLALIVFASIVAGIGTTSALASGDFGISLETSPPAFNNLPPNTTVTFTWEMTYVGPGPNNGDGVFGDQGNVVAFSPNNTIVNPDRNLTFQSLGATPAGWSCDTSNPNDTILCTVPTPITMAPGDSFTFTATYQSSTGIGSRSPNATVSATNDSSLNNSASVSLHTLGQTNTVATPDIASGNAHEGDDVTFDIEVELNDPFTGAVPIGSVNVTVDNVDVTPTDVFLNAGTGSFTLNNVTAGTHTIVFSYSGSQDHEAGTFTLAYVVQAPLIATTTTLSVSPTGSADFRDLVTFTATVTGASTPSGTVRFFSGSTEVGSASLSGAGVATFQTAALAGGTQQLTAVYQGSQTHAGSTSAAVSYEITNAPPSADLGILLTRTPATVPIGDTVTYIMTVTNSGPGAAGFVNGNLQTETDDLAFESSNVLSGGATCGPQGSDVISCGVSSLAAAGFFSVELTYRVKTGAIAPIFAQGSISAQANTSVDPDLSNNTADVQTDVGDNDDDAIFHMTVQRSTFTGVGQTNNITFAVENTGGTTLTNIAVNSAQLPGLTCTAASLPAGDELECDTSYTSTQADVDAGSYVIEAQATMEGTQQATITRNARFTATFQPPTSSNVDLAVSLAATPDPVLAGGQVTYQIRVTNNGPDAAEQSTANFGPPAGLNVASITPVGGSTCQTINGAIICIVGNVAVGASFGADIVVDVPADRTQALVAEGGISSSGANVTDPNPTNNNAELTTQVTPLVPLTPTQTALSAATFSIPAGQTAAFTANVTSGNGTPNGGTVEFFEGSNSLGTATVANGAATLTTTRTFAAGAYQITAVYSGDTTFAGSQTAAASTLTAVAPPDDALAIGVDGPTSFSAAGDVGPYNVSVSNVGNTTLTNIVVNAPNSNGLNCTVATLAPGADFDCPPATHTATDAEVAAGGFDFTANADYTGEEDPGTRLNIDVTLRTPFMAPPSVAEEVGEDTDEFLRARNALLAQGIETPSINDRGGSGSFTTTENGGLPTMNFATSLLNPGAAAAEELAAARAAGSLDAWIKGTFSLYERPAGGGTFGLLGLGVDYMFGENVLLGGAIYIDLMRDDTATTDINGAGVSVGPYASIQITDGIVLDVSAFVGRSSNDVTSLIAGDTFSGRFETNRFLFKARLEGEWLIDQLTLRPDATVFLSHESSGDYTVVNALGATALVPGSTVNTARASVGLTASYDIEFDGMTMSPFAGVSVGVTNPQVAAPLAGAFATFEAGLMFDMGQFGASVEVNGQADASGFHAGGIQAGVNGSF